MTDGARFLKKKKIGCPNWGPTCLYQAQNEVFRHFLKFVSLVFLEIAYNDSLQQCLTSSGGKTHKKIWRPKFGPNKPKSGSKLRFLSFSQVWVIVFLEIANDDSLQHLVEIKLTKKILGSQIVAKIGPEIRFFAIFSSLVH